MSDWQPIKTAPKDGTRIVILCDWDDVAVVGYFGKPRHGTGLPHWRVWWDDADFDEAFEATHWLPLPTPPEQEE